MSLVHMYDNLDQRVSVDNSGESVGCVEDHGESTRVFRYYTYTPSEMV